MDANTVKIKIHGDFLDSYIYSGWLFLIERDYSLSIFKWEPIAKKILKNTEHPPKLLDFIKDSRKNIDKDYFFEIDIEELRNETIHKKNIGVWPSDISLYSNKMYISSELGVAVCDFFYGAGTIGTEKYIYEKTCYSVAPNSHNRVAFATGSNGVQTYIPTSKFFTKDQVKTIVDKDCIDIDWQLQDLYANSSSGVFHIKYKELPNKENYDDDEKYWADLNESKKSDPDARQIDDLIKSWRGGDSIFGLTKDGLLIKTTKNHREILHQRKISNPDKIRTATFGTLIEENNTLHLALESGLRVLSSNQSTWRIFPRAKQYLKHLHIVHDDYIELSIIDPKFSSPFGFSISDLNIDQP